jgi:urate oxidase
MPAVLTHDTYGKAQVRLTRVNRQAGRHDLKELCVAVQLQGDFAASYTDGDNSRVIPTDTMKNIVYALAGKQMPANVWTTTRTFPLP